MQFTTAKFKRYVNSLLLLGCRNTGKRDYPFAVTLTPSEPDTPAILYLTYFSTPGNKAIIFSMSEQVKSYTEKPLRVAVSWIPGSPTVTEQSIASAELPEWLDESDETTFELIGKFLEDNLQSGNEYEDIAPLHYNLFIDIITSWQAAVERSYM